jgi:hypothetical protein
LTPEELRLVSEFRQQMKVPFEAGVTSIMHKPMVAVDTNSSSLG